MPAAAVVTPSQARNRWLQSSECAIGLPGNTAPVPELYRLGLRHRCTFAGQ